MKICLIFVLFLLLLLFLCYFNQNFVQPKIFHKTFDKKNLLKRCDRNRRNRNRKNTYWYDKTF